MSYLVIGAGSIGTRHQTNLAALGAESRLISWRDTDLDDLRAALKTARSMVIATATDVRLALIAMAAEESVPLYIEKPLAFRPADVAAIYDITHDIAERSVLGYMMRYHPFVRYISDAMPQIFGFHFEIGHDVRQWRKNWCFAESYAARAEGGGVLLDLCHEIDLAYCLLPLKLDVEMVSCVGFEDYPGVDFSTRVAMTGNTCAGTVAMDYLSPESVRRFSLRGFDEVIDVDLLAGQLRWWCDGEVSKKRCEVERNDMFLDLMRDFIALAEGRAPSDNLLIPRLDRCRDSAELVASAWERRTFHGSFEGGFA